MTGTSSPTRRSRRAGASPEDLGHRARRRTGGPRRGATTIDSIGTPSAGDVVRVHWYEGGDAFGGGRSSIGEAAIAEATALLGVTEDEPIDFFIYADPRRVLRGARARHARERGRPGERRYPDAVRAHPVEPDQRSVGRDRRPARARPPRLRYRGLQPVPLPAALAQRGPGRVPERGLRRVAIGGPSRPRPRTAR